MSHPLLLPFLPLCHLSPNFPSTIPRNDRHPQYRGNDAKHQGHNPPRRKPIRQGFRTPIRPPQIQQIFHVTSGITGDRQILLRAGVEMGLRDSEGFLQGEWGFDHCCDEARGDMPFDVAVKEPDAWVIGAEAQDDVAVGPDHEGVATHGNGGEGLVADVVTCIVGGAGNGLEVVPMQVEGVLACVLVVEDDVDDVAFGEDEGVSVGTVD